MSENADARAGAKSELERARDQLQTLAKLGWGSAAFSAVLSVFGLLTLIPKLSRASDRSEATFMLGFFGLQLVVAAFVALGMRCALRFTSYPLAVSGAALAMLPFTGPCLVLVLPAGVGCFAALAKAETGRLFAARTIAALPERLPAVALGLSLVGFALFPAALAGAALGVWILARSDQRLPAAQRRRASAAVGAGAGGFWVSCFIVTPLFMFMSR